MKWIKRYLAINRQTWLTQQLFLVLHQLSFHNNEHYVQFQQTVEGVYCNIWRGCFPLKLHQTNVQSTVC